MRPQSSKSTGRKSRSGTTCGRSRRKATTPLTSSAAASHAKTSALPEKEPGSAVRGPVFGTSLLGSFAQFGHDGWSSKTCQLSLLEDSEPFSETWPRSGWMRSGIAYRLVPLVRRTDETESGLLPTPAAHEPGWKHIEVVDRDGNPPSHANQRFYDMQTGRLVQKGLTQVVTMFPTPSASGMPCEGTVRLARKAWLDGMATLEEANAIAGRDVRKAQGKVRAWLPTPTAMGHHTGGRITEWGGSSARSQVHLLAEAGLLHKKEVSGSLNPTWVEWLMGFPLDWTALDASATPSSRKSSKSSGGRLSRTKKRTGGPVEPA